MKKVHLYIFSLFLLMFFCVNVDDVKAADGLVCYYTSDNTFGVKMTSANTYQGGEDDLKKMSPAACVIGVIKRPTGKYESALHCKAKKSNNEVIEIKISDYYDNVFGVNAPNWKTVYGFKKGNGVTKCPDTISFETTMFPTIANGYSSWEAGAFAFSDKYGCESDPEKTTIDSNHCMRLSDNSKIKSSEWKGMDEYKKQIVNMLAGKEVYWDQDHVNPSSRVQRDDDENINASYVQGIRNALDSLGNESYGVSTDGSVECEALLGPKNVKLLGNIFRFIMVLGVILVIVLGTTDFIKAIASSDDDALKQAINKIKYRIISVVVLLLLSVLINFVLGIINDNLHFEIKKSENEKKDVSIKIGKASDCGQ